MRIKSLLVAASLVAIIGFHTPVRAQADPPADPFPNPEGLRESVEFWKQVWSTWSLGQVALHDVEHPALVYEVLELPGGPSETYTAAQREFVRACRTDLETRLKTLEAKVALGVPLDESEKRLALAIGTAAGTDAIRGASTRVRSQRGLRERFRRGLEISGRYMDEFRRIFREAGLPEDLAYLPHVESSFQAEARSSAGAVGIWQFTRPAARLFMTVHSAIDERLDPVAAARGAARYLGSAYAELGDWALAVTSYNHGVEGMRRAKSRFGTDFERVVREYDGKTFGFASRNFYAEFLAAREIASNPGLFFPEGIAAEPPFDHDRLTLSRPATALRLAQRYGVPLGDLAALNPGWTRRAVRAHVPLPAGTVVWLPRGRLTRVAGRAAAPTAATVAAKEPATGAR